MPTQNYANHRKIDPKFHYVLMLLSTLAFLGSIIYVITSIVSGGSIMTSLLLFLLSIIIVLLAIIIRIYSLKVQDRTIHVEQNLRHFALTGKLLDPKLSLRQIIALRFAEDEEFISLCVRAVTENMKPDKIKQSIQQWKADNHRV